MQQIHSCCMRTFGAQSMVSGWIDGETAMTNGVQHHRLLLPLIAIAATFAGADFARAQTTDGPDLSIELVDPKVLRVCADPRNLPFSNEKGEGFENKLAAFFAEKLQKKLDYM